MPFNQYHEPPAELPEETRTFARLILSLIEEAEAIDWYEQRRAVEKDEEVRSLLRYVQKEEMIHFSLDLEAILRRNPTWRKIAQTVLFKQAALIELGEKAESALEDE